MNKKMLPRMPTSGNLSDPYDAGYYDGVKDQQDADFKRVKPLVEAVVGHFQYYYECNCGAERYEDCSDLIEALAQLGVEVSDGQG